MYYRRKIILALLQEFGGKLNKTDFQKFLFLITEEQKEKSFDFIPYKYGCYSFQASADKKTMIKYNLIEDSEEWIKKDTKDYLSELKKSDQSIIKDIKTKYYHLSGKNLLKYVYKKYPNYAFNSLVIDKIGLTNSEIEKIEKSKPYNNKKVFYTIGYEGKTLDKYLKYLIDNDIKILIDIRKNPISMKFGFSKKQLKDAVEKINIKYIHIPELGIDSEKRKNLDKKSDYDNLFNYYFFNIIPKNTNNLKNIVNILNEYKRIAITCFEKDLYCCHRSKVLEAILHLLPIDCEIKHL